MIITQESTSNAPAMMTELRTPPPSRSDSTQMDSSSSLMKRSASLVDNFAQDATDGPDAPQAQPNNCISGANEVAMTTTTIVETPPFNPRCWFVANLPMSWNNEQLEYELWSRLSANALMMECQIESVRAMRDNQGRPIAFVHFSKEMPDPTIALGEPLIIGGRQLRIEHAQSPNTLKKNQQPPSNYLLYPHSDPSMILYPTCLWIKVLVPYQRRWLRQNYCGIYQLCSQFTDSNQVLDIRPMITSPYSFSPSSSNSSLTESDIYYANDRMQDKWLQVTFATPQDAFQCLECVQRYPPLGLQFCPIYPGK